MATLSAEEYRAKYGFKSNTPSQPGVISSAIDRIGQVVNQGTEEMGQIADQYGAGKQGLFSSALQTAGVAGKGFGTLQFDLLKSILPSSVKEPIKKAVSSVAETKTAQSLISSYEDFRAKHPEAAKDLEAFVNLSSALPSVKVVEGAAGAVSTIGKGLAKSAESKADEAAKYVIDSAGTLKNVSKKAVEKLADSDLITPMDKGLKNEIGKATGGEIEKYFKIAKEGAEDYSKPSALDHVGEIAGGALKKMDSLLKATGKKKGEEVAKIAEQSTGNIVYKTRVNLRKEIESKLGGKITKDGVVSAPGRVLKIADSDKALLKEIDDTMAEISTNPTFQRVDDAIGKIQGILYKTEKNLTIPADKGVVAVGKKVIKDLNDELKTIGGPKYKAYKAAYAELSKRTKELNKLLGPEGKNAGGLMKRVFSPSDAGTKKLFNRIKEITGVDLIKEATLAKYAMEKIGDARSASMLEQLNLLKPAGAIGTIEKAAKFFIDKSIDPKRKALKYAKPKN